MQVNSFFYADISTYNTKKSIDFYRNVFQWKFYNSDNYYTAFLNNTPVIGLYETPNKFQEMQMPHFWMSYILVEDIENVVANAKLAGGIIEMSLENELGKFALIRDPLGAGFTVYEGNILPLTRTENEANTLIWNELHVSSAQNVIPFYNRLFDWKFKQLENGLYAITSINRHIGDLMEMDDSLKGKYQYWVCTFGVKHIARTEAQILKNGGSIIYKELSRILVTDNSNEAFFYIKEV